MAYAAIGAIRSENEILSVLEDWLEGDGLFLRQISLNGNGCIDGVLLPGWAQHVAILSQQDDERSTLPWERAGLVGFEVKTSRQRLTKDTKKQFPRYAKVLLGLYIVTTPGVCVDHEISDEYGHIVVRQGIIGTPVIQCLRHPKFKKPEEDLHPKTFWQIIFRLFKKFGGNEIDL